VEKPVENVEKSTVSTSKPFASPFHLCGKPYVRSVNKAYIYLHLQNYVATVFTLFPEEIPSKSSVFRDLPRKRKGAFGFMP